MTKPVDDFFEQSMLREDTVDAMIGSGYGDIIDIIEEGAKVSIFSNKNNEGDEIND
jgi:hypothetical protein